MTAPFLWLADAVFRVVRGWSLHEQTWAVSGLSVDITKTKPGDLFFAIDDPFLRGHDSVAAAFVAGATAAVVSRQPMHVPSTAPLIFVEDTRAALLALAREARLRTKSKILAVVGNAERESVRQMLRLALSAIGKTCVFDCAEGASLGLYLALAGLPTGADYAVLGLDLSHPSDVMMELIRPDIAVVTPAEGPLFRTKDFLKGMDQGAVVIANKDAARLVGAVAKSQGIRKIFHFSESAKADACLINCALAGKEYIVNAVIHGKKINYMMNLSSLKEVPYSLAAMLAAVEAGGKGEVCAAALLGYRAAPLSGKEEAFSAPYANKNIT